MQIKSEIKPPTLNSNQIPQNHTDVGPKTEKKLKIDCTYQ